MTLARMYSKDRIRDDSGTISITSQRITQRGSSGSKSNSIIIIVPALTNCLFLLSTIDAGSIIEDKLHTSQTKVCSSLYQRGTVVGICLELDRKTKSGLLNNGDKLLKSLHMVRRISIRNIYTGEVM